MTATATTKPARKTLPTDGAVLRAEIAETLLRLREQGKAGPRRALRERDRELLTSVVRQYVGVS